MLNKTLGLVDLVEVSCDSCSKKLEIPVDIYFAVELARENSGGSSLGKSHGSFYVSPESNLCGTMGFCCDKECYDFSTED